MERGARVSEAGLEDLDFGAKEPVVIKQPKKLLMSERLSDARLFVGEVLESQRRESTPVKAAAQLFASSKRGSEASSVKSAWSEFDNFEKPSLKAKKDPSQKSRKEEERLRARAEELTKLKYIPVAQPVIKDISKNLKKPKKFSNIKFNPTKVNAYMEEALEDIDADSIVQDLELKFERILTHGGNERLFYDVLNHEKEAEVDKVGKDLVVKTKDRCKDFNLFSTFKVSEVDPKESNKTKLFAMEQRKKNDIFGELYRDMVKAGASSQEKRAFQLMLLKYRTLTRGVLATFPPLPQVENFDNPDEFLMSKVCKPVAKKPTKLTFMDVNDQKVTVKFQPPPKSQRLPPLKAEQDAFEKKLMAKVALKPRSLREISRRRPVIKSSTEAAVVAYHDRANISFILDYLMTFLMFNCPDDPIEFLYDLTSKVVCARKDRKMIEELPRIYEKKHMEAYFRLLDQEERGYITLRQYKSALQSLGVYEYKEDPFGFDEDRIPEYAFVNEAWSGVETNFMLFLSSRS